MFDFLDKIKLYYEFLFRLITNPDKEIFKEITLIIESNQTESFKTYIHQINWAKPFQANYTNML